MSYKSRVGLWYHSKKCEKPQPGINTESSANPDYMTIISQLLNQNNELKNFIIEQTQDYKRETTDILNRVIEQASEHKKDTVDIITKVIEQKKSSNI